MSVRLMRRAVVLALEVEAVCLTSRRWPRCWVEAVEAAACTAAAGVPEHRSAGQAAGAAGRCPPPAGRVVTMCSMIAVVDTDGVQVGSIDRVAVLKVIAGEDLALAGDR